MKRAVAFIILAVAFASGAFAQSKDTDKKENLSNCLLGFSDCNLSLLPQDQAQEISTLNQDRNLWNCLTGYGTCDRSKLSATGEGGSRCRP
jgi:hypothetical protein